MPVLTEFLQNFSYSEIFSRLITKRSLHSDLEHRVTTRGLLVIALGPRLHKFMHVLLRHTTPIHHTTLEVSSAYTVSTSVTMATVTTAETTLCSQEDLHFFANYFAEEYTVTKPQREKINSSELETREFLLQDGVYDPFMVSDESVDERIRAAFFDNYMIENAEEKMKCDVCSSVIGMTQDIDSDDEIDMDSPEYYGVFVPGLILGVSGAVHCDCLDSIDHAYRCILTRTLAARILLAKHPTCESVMDTIEYEIDGNGEGTYEDFIGTVCNHGVSKDILDFSKILLPPKPPAKRPRTNDEPDTEPRPVKIAKTIM